MKLTQFAVGSLMETYDPHQKTTLLAEPSRLQALVEKYSFERHYSLNRKANIKCKEMLAEDFKATCDNVSLADSCNNIVAEWGDPDVPKITITGHYDGPPDSPGADDNGSALATMIHLSELLCLTKPDNVRFVAFNREEEGILGSQEFCARYNLKNIDHVVNLEMVGYFKYTPNSQTMPDGFPPLSVGNFLAIIGNRNSKDIISNFIAISKEINSDLPIRGIKIPLGLENKMTTLEHVRRSDHSRFWDKNIPAVMLTDTAEFRNKNYHQSSDLPNTLNYDAMANVVNLLYHYVKGGK